MQSDNLENRIIVYSQDGRKVVAVKQGSKSDFIWMLCALICACLGYYFAFHFQNFDSLPLSKVVKFWIWVLVVVFLSTVSIWYGIAYEIFAVEKNVLLVEIRVSKFRFFAATFSTLKISNPRLHHHRSKSRGYWKICFECDGKTRELETRFYTKEDGYFFRDKYLIPMLANEF